MKKNTIRLDENTLRKIVAESVKKVLKEGVRNLNELGEEIREIEAHAQELLDKIGALETRVNARYGYMPTNNDENDEGIKKNLESAYSAMKQCVFSLDNAFQYYDGGIGCSDDKLN